MKDAQTFDGILVGKTVLGQIAKKYIYQRSHGGFQRKAYKVPFDPNTEEQAFYRRRFGDAVNYAQGLNPTQKQVYIDLAARPWEKMGYPYSALSGRTWFNWAISAWMNSF